MRSYVASGGGCIDEAVTAIGSDSSDCGEVESDSFASDRRIWVYAAWSCEALQGRGCVWCDPAGYGGSLTSHDRVAGDPDGTVRRLCNFCGSFCRAGDCSNDCNAAGGDIYGSSSLWVQLHQAASCNA